MMTQDEVKQLIEQAIPGSHVKIGEFGCGGDHLTCEVIASAFAGKSRVAQHQMVYAALRGHIDSGVIHALALTTKDK